MFFFLLLGSAPGVLAQPVDMLGSQKQPARPRPEQEARAREQRQKLFQQWAGRLLQEYPRINLYRARPGTAETVVLKTQVANLFSDDAFVPVFGRAYDQLTEEQLAWILANTVQGCPLPQSIAPLREAFEPNGRIYLFGSPEMRRLAGLSREAKKTLAAIRAQLQARDAAGHAQAVALADERAREALKHVWPSDVEAFNRFVDSTRREMIAHVLASLPPETLSDTAEEAKLRQELAQLRGLPRALATLERQAAWLASFQPRAQRFEQNAELQQDLFALFAERQLIYEAVAPQIEKAVRSANSAPAIDAEIARYFPTATDRGFSAYRTATQAAQARRLELQPEAPRGPGRSHVRSSAAALGRLEEMASATGVSRLTGIRELGAVRLRCTANRLVRDAVSDSQVEGLIAEALARTFGLSVDPTATAELAVELNLDRWDYASEREGALVDKRSLGVLTVTASIAVPADVLQAGRIFHLTVQLASAATARLPLAKLEAQPVTQAITSVLELLKAESELDRGPATSDTSWQKRLTDIASNESVSIPSRATSEASGAYLPWLSDITHVAGYSAGTHPLNRDLMLEVALWGDRLIGEVSAHLPPFQAAALRLSYASRLNAPAMWRETLWRAGIGLERGDNAAFSPRVDFRLRSVGGKLDGTSSLATVFAEAALTAPDCVIETPRGKVRVAARLWRYQASGTALLTQNDNVSEEGFRSLVIRLSRQSAAAFLEAVGPHPGRRAALTRVAPAVLQAFDALNAGRAPGFSEPLLWRYEGKTYIAGLDPATNELVAMEVSLRPLREAVRDGLASLERNAGKAEASRGNLMATLRNAFPELRLALEGYPSRYLDYPDFLRAAEAAPLRRLTLAGPPPEAGSLGDQVFMEAARYEGIRPDGPETRLRWRNQLPPNFPGFVLQCWFLPPGGSTTREVRGFWYRAKPPAWERIAQYLPPEHPLLELGDPICDCPPTLPETPRPSAPSTPPDPSRTRRTPGER